MRHEEYLQHKRELEERHRAGIELLEAAYRAEMQALETLRAAAGGRTPEAAGTSPTEAAPAPPGKPAVVRQAPGKLAEQILAALPRVPQNFNRNDLLQVLDGVPNRASLYRVLQQLVDGGILEQTDFGSGRRLSVYRKVGAAPGPAE